MTQKASPFSYAVAIALLTTAVGGGLYMGALAQDVEQLKEARQSLEEDHDNIVTLTADMKHIKASMDETNETLKELVRVLNTIKQKVQ